MRIIERVLVFLKIDFQNWIYTLSSLVTICIEVLIDNIIFLLILLSYKNVLSMYIENYTNYVLIGLLVYDILMTIEKALYSALQRGYWNCIFDAILFAPNSFLPYVISHLIENLLLSTIRAIILVLSFFLLFGLTLKFKVIDLVLAFLVTILSIIAMVGLGLIEASTFILTNSKRGSPLSHLLDFVIKILSGAYIPLQLIPAYIRLVSYFLPHTYIIELYRYIFLGTSINVNLFLQVLTVQSLTLIILGYMLFKLALRRARENASLLLWI
ncbi:MAG: hypothetical protein DRN04_10335 [Thermoprotei archaeon]|nr:MAG: hypothetical protein DRN04_10335 [Thermoprotei archaeon]